MSAAAIEHNRRAVYTALSGVCSDRLLLERAFAFWETNFAAQAVFRVAQYIDGLMQQVGLNQEQRRALSIALYSALNKQDRELAEVPAMFRGAAPAAAAPSTATEGTAARASVATVASTQETIFAAILSGIVEGVARAGKTDDLTASLEDARVRFSDGAKVVIGEWLERGLAGADRVAARVPDLHHAMVLNQVYVALCDAVGPVLADRIL